MSQTILDLEDDKTVTHLGHVVAIHLKPARGVLEPVECLDAVKGKGLIGDRSFGRRTRQVSLVSLFELRPSSYLPGQLRENITVDFEGLQNLPLGTVLKVGTSELAIESDCQPCGGMARRLGEDPQEFMKKMTRKRGMLAKVVCSGHIRVGDVIYLVGG